MPRYFLALVFLVGLLLGLGFLTLPVVLVGCALAAVVGLLRIPRMRAAREEAAYQAYLAKDAEWVAQHGDVNSVYRGESNGVKMYAMRPRNPRSNLWWGYDNN